jgi:hypothetical protein
MNKKALVISTYLVAALLVVAALVYFTVPADQLPAFLPGHDASMTKPHSKHGIAAILLALGCVVFAWFQGGSKSSQENQG